MKIIVFTGAGVSRESGLQTFRDSKDGLWEGHRVEDVASIDGWRRDPQRVLDFYNQRRRDVLAAMPNAGHLSLAELERGHDVTVITQNVDDLHERAGSTKVIHLHGEVLKARTAGFEHEDEPPITWLEDLNLGHLHPRSGKQLRPHIVWFGEGLPEISRALEIAHAPDVDVLIVVGTTLSVYPAAWVATGSKASRIYLVDPDPPDLPLPNLKVYADGACAGLRRVVDEINAARRA
jgi:NAD-dependent deacetylase